MPIQRGEGIAEIIVDEHEGHSIPLIGFSCDENKTDFEIAEEAYEYYQELMRALDKDRENQI